MPWYPPRSGIYGGDVSFFYATYLLTGIGLVIACGLYYWAWVSWVPLLRGYRLRQEIVFLENGAQTNNLVKVPIDQLATWDAEHDKSGRKLEEAITPEIVNFTKVL
ncbi:hypothetical protein SEPCBS57363_006018 [Sporothrix epigloea]|uniref:Uncharacterized protein n=1 Tax=Sporothrix epigloea TaxID=1892477 RepID=A0ABP0E0S2_9PEZI